MLGCSPRFKTPGHHQSSGLVERFNQSYKRMIKCVIADNPKPWLGAIMVRAQKVDIDAGWKDIIF